MRPQTRMKRARAIYAKYKHLIERLIREIKALDTQTPTGLHGINYEQSRVMGGKMRDISDILTDKEERRARLYRELNETITAQFDELDRLDRQYKASRAGGTGGR